MKTHIHIGQLVFLKQNPNPVEVIYRIVDINVYVEDGSAKAVATLAVRKDYLLPDGGRILMGQQREENVIDITPVAE